MFHLLTCPQGHQFEIELDGSAPPGSEPLRCPVCGEPVRPAAPAGADPGAPEAETLPPEVVPMEMVMAADPTRSGHAVQPAEAVTVPPGEPATYGTGGWPVVAGYEILGELGRGGMGVVYKARQRGLGRLVALKVVLAGAHAGASELARFRDEARAAATLQHPNIVQVFEVGEQDGRPYFSLEYVDGGSLARRLDGTPLAPRLAARLVETLARAVHQAHRQGIVHRDLKPANVLLANGELPASGTGGSRPPLAGCIPKIADFGLAKRADQEHSQTATGAVLGTPSYMAPEQAGGNGSQVGPPADIYGLGAILYELLTGRPPFKAETPLDTILQVLSEEPVPPSRVNMKVPADLETVCLKCLQKDPRKRYASAEALAEDLRRFREGLPVTARPAGAWERAWRWCRRNPVVAGLLAAVMLSLALGTAAATFFAVRAYREKHRAEEQTAAAKQYAAQANDETLRAEWAVYAGQIALAHSEWRGGWPRQAREALEACGWGFRGWEHGFLRHYFNRQEPLLAARRWGTSAHEVAFSPDGQRVAIADRQLTYVQEKPAPGKRIIKPPVESGVIYVWDAATGQPLPSLHGPAAFRCLAFSPHGKRLAAGDAKGVVRVWDAPRTALPARLVKGILKPAPVAPGPPRELLTLACEAAPVHGLAFSPDGRRLVTCAGGGRSLHDGRAPSVVTVWDMTTGQVLLTLPGLPVRDKTGVAYSPDGRRIAAGGSVAGDWGRRAAGAVRVWDAKTGREVVTFRGHDWEVRWVAFGPDGERVASCGGGAIRVWDAGTGREALRLQGRPRGASSLAFSRDGRRIAAGTWNGSVRVWEAATGQALVTVEEHAFPVSGLALSPDGRRIASVSSDDAKVWDLDLPECLTLEGHGIPVSAMAFRPDGKRLAGRSQLGTIRVWDVTDGKEVLPVPVKGNFVAPCNLAFSPDGQRLASGAGDRLMVWDAATGAELFSRAHAARVRGVAWSRDGKSLASASADGAVKVGAAAVGLPERTFWGPRIGLFGVCGPAFSPDAKLLASAGFREVTVWEVASGRKVLTIPSPRWGINCLAFSPDGKRLLGGGLDRTMKVWDAHTGRELFSLVAAGRVGHAVYGVACNPDGTRFAAGDDHTVSIWETERGQRVLALTEPGGAIRDVAFSPDGRHLAAACDDGTVKVWTADP